MSWPLLLALVATAGSGQLGPRCPTGELDCVQPVVETMLERGEAREAIQLLKPVAQAKPGNQRAVLLLTRAYLAADNLFWALRTLSSAIQRAPNNCELRAWLVFLQLQAAEPSEAERLLAQPGCPGDSGPLVARWALLQAMVAEQLRQWPSAGEALTRARAAPATWREDRRAIRQLTPRLVPGWSAPLRWRLNLALGATSNALSGAPTDPQAAQGAASLLGKASLWGLAKVDLGLPMMPMLELDLRSLGLTDSLARDLSWLDLGVRPALRFQLGDRDLTLGYRFDTLGLAGGDPLGDGGYWLFEAHRLELDLVLEDLSILLGGGRRLFQDLARVRTEVDLGLGGRFSVGPLKVLWAFSGRWHRAHQPAYNLLGGTLVANIRFKLPLSLRGRLKVGMGLDEYPDSSDYFEPGVTRLDSSMLAGLGLWHKLGRGKSLELTWDLAVRTSDVAAYSYQEHRVVLTFTWYKSQDTGGPSKLNDPSHVPLDFGVGAGESAEEQDRIQDLLRQDEAARRGSSCVN